MASKKQFEYRYFDNWATDRIKRLNKWGEAVCEIDTRYLLMKREKETEENA